MSVLYQNDLHPYYSYKKFLHQSEFWRGAAGAGMGRRVKKILLTRLLLEVLIERLVDTELTVEI